MAEYHTIQINFIYFLQLALQLQYDKHKKSFFPQLQLSQRAPILHLQVLISSKSFIRPEFKSSLNQ